MIYIPLYAFYLTYPLCAGWLLCPPPVEEGLLDIRKLAVGVELALLDHCVDNVLHACVLDRVVGPWGETGGIGWGRSRQKS
jgi:hypothetical protein